jgi:FkbM family methyltransferase
MKNIVQKIFILFGYKILKLKTSFEFDDIYKKIFGNKKKLIIFDVGANKGQSIERFLKIFGKNCIIHAFEPIKEEYLSLQKKYLNYQNIILNNFALGANNANKKFYVNIHSGSSSFNKLQNTIWLKQRSKEYKVKPVNFVKKAIYVQIKTLDEYCLEKLVNCIDILKIDTQGYEDQVLLGSKNILYKKIINAIECEIMLDNIYDKRITIMDIEKYLVPNFRLSGIKTTNNSLFEGISFFVDCLYLKSKIISTKFINEKFKIK